MKPYAAYNIFSLLITKEIKYNESQLQVLDNNSIVSDE